MFPKSISSPVVCSALHSESPRRYRHDPYGTSVLKPLPLLSPAGTAISSVCVTLSPSNTATDSCSDTASYEFPPMIRAPRSETFKAFVSFKYGAKEFVAHFRVHVGQAVVTEGDRGEDLGFVQHVQPISGSLPQSKEKIIRVATESDMQTHCARAQKERESLYTMRTLAKQVRCFAFIQDIMYQLDSRKITVIISRDSRTYVDFRRLQRAAFDVFRCRVWFAYLDEITIPQNGAVENFPPPHW